jgi:hypothetical protein
MSIGAHKKVDLVLKNKSLKKSKVVIGIWYASGGKKFNLQDNFILSSVVRRGGLLVNDCSLTPGFTRGHSWVALAGLWLT